MYFNKLKIQFQSVSQPRLGPILAGLVGYNLNKVIKLNVSN